ncbi:MAG: hypothetical protein M0005_17570 [Actinomycetota bacterium]|jgi:hypothetical protein|nr:hypothetical protein [Actinomycetota bacterium]
MAQDPNSLLVVLKEALGDAFRSSLSILLNPPSVGALNREVASDEHRQDALKHSGLHGLIDQQVRCHILDTPARA